MTTTVNKQGLKKAAQERSNRHAQRTPLPPRPGQVEAAREPLDAFDAALPADSKSCAKAIAVRKAMTDNGWSTILVPAEGTDAAQDEWELTARRGDETLWISWTKGTLTTNPMPSYTIADRTVKLRNASAVKQYASRAPEVGSSELQKVASNKFFKRKPSTPKASRLPFDPATATEIEIIEALMGKAVAWHNRLREMNETAFIGRDRRRIHFTEFAGERIFNFLCPETGFRAFKLSALTRVGSRKFRTKGERSSGAHEPVEVED